MKLMFLSAILLMGCAAFASAQVEADEIQTAPDEQIIQVVTTDEYKEVALTDLCAGLQEAIKNLAGETFEVQKVEFNAEKALTKVTLTNKVDESEKLVILDKEGKELKEDEASAEE